MTIKTFIAGSKPSYDAVVAMKPGRTLDVLVCEAIGWRWFTIVGAQVLVPPYQAEEMDKRPVLYTPGRGEIKGGMSLSNSDFNREFPEIPKWSDENETVCLKLLTWLKNQDIRWEANDSTHEVRPGERLILVELSWMGRDRRGPRYININSSGMSLPEAMSKAVVLAKIQRGWDVELQKQKNETAGEAAR